MIPRTKRTLRHAPVCATIAAMLFGIFACRREQPASQNSSKAVLADSSTPQWFVDIAEQSGLLFTNETGATGQRHMPEITGFGAAIFDCDNDGDLDIYCINGAFLFGAKPPGDPPQNRLFMQENGKFVDRTAASGLGDPSYGMGVAVADIDNDGDRDVYVTNYGPDRLFRNEGQGRFTDVTEAAGIDVPGWSASAAFLDYDRDGFLDLYVCQYLNYDPGRRCTDQAGRPDYCGPTSFTRLPDVLLHNNGDGTFADVSESSGVAGRSSYGLGVVCADLNEDSWPDIYVANDQLPNSLWINQQNGTFVDQALSLGVALNGQGMAEGSMGVVAADFDNDRDFDLFITNLRHESNRLYRNLGGGFGFDDHSASAGLAQSSIPFTGFGTAAFDADLDGHLDIVVVNASVTRRDPISGSDVAPPWDEYAEPNAFYRNNGNGAFSQLDEPVAAFTSRVEVSRGLATGDIDDDGDVDFLVVNAQGPARLYRNDAPARGHWLTVQAIDPRYQRDAIGAVVAVLCQDTWYTRLVHTSDSYMCSSDPRCHFGLGSAASYDEIHITWPDGLRERFAAGPANSRVALRRGEGLPVE